MKGKTVYAYDPQTGEFVEPPYPYCRQAEKAVGAYRGAIAEAFQNNRQTPVGGFFWSFIKKDQYKLSEQGKNGNQITFSTVTPQVSILPSVQSIDQFLKTNDAPAIVAGKVELGLSKLKPDKLYTLDALYELIGLPKGFPHLRTTIDAYKEYYGSGMVDGKLRFGHPDTISFLKQKKAMK